MNAITQTTLPAIGTPMPGGFFAGAYLLNGQRRALIVSSRKIGISLKGAWHEDEIDVPGAKSYNDGMANTLAMAEAGSSLAKTVLEMEIDGLKDFYIPSQDELEICYRAFKPTTEQNWCYARSGINLSALPPTYPYTPEFPVQTALDAFKAGGEEAFEADWHWSSTQRAGISVYAWYQDFRHGTQGIYDFKSAELRVRAVRSQPI
ncbi:hypothetical protein GALL_71750 [mine drainage metagenome]|uniref:DUF1566 domain-containing protein n=1 Tax=mine drainage metagenome TaxID=410659 RepID=A0A1J5TB44_9ZZZZ